MNISRSITGNLINAYFICHRKVWLFAHEVGPTSDNQDMSIGRLIDRESYKREKRQIMVGNINIDFIQKQGQHIVVAEVKKSSKGKKAARMQLLFYLYNLKQMGISAVGELLIPMEKKKLMVSLDEKSMGELEKAIREIQEIIRKDRPPRAKWSKFCKNCAFYEFCFSDVPD